MERTLVVLKPDAVQRGVVGEIITRFEKVGLKVVAAKMLQPSEDHYFHHYETIGKVVSRRGKEVFDMNLDYMMMGPVIAFVLEGIEAVELVRKMVGATEPKSALPGTIRGDYAHMSYAHGDKAKTGIPNLVHASGDSDEAKLEVAHWFSESEIFDYTAVHEKYTQKGKK
ncbi:nucleoside-diphosphate kinase [Candidatus Saccharibacteria bacterium]|nr:nucleoside-diphosphate kinase [Candidatus Saccharibacteria bacterium]